MSDNSIIPKWQAPGAADEIYDHATAAAMAGINARLFLKYWKMGLIRPIGDIEHYGIYFDQEAIYLTRQAELMRQEFSIDMRAAIVIVKLKQEVENLREELRFWRR